MATSTKIEVRMWWTPLMTFNLVEGEFEIHNGESKPSSILIDNFKDNIQNLKFEIYRDIRRVDNTVEITFITSKTNIVIDFEDNETLKAFELFNTVYKLLAPIIDANNKCKNGF